MLKTSWDFILKITLNYCVFVSKIRFISKFGYLLRFLSMREKMDAMTKNFEQEFVTEQEFHSRFFCTLAIDIFVRVPTFAPKHVSSQIIWPVLSQNVTHIMWPRVTCRKRLFVTHFRSVTISQNPANFWSYLRKPTPRGNPKMYKNLIFDQKRFAQFDFPSRAPIFNRERWLTFH